MKKVAALVLCALLILGITGCAADDGAYVVGMCQYMDHPSLNSAAQGFKDAMTEELGEQVTFKEKDAGGDHTICVSIMDGFVAEGVDLILANSTAPLQAARSATATIPILGTSITDYAAALNYDTWTGIAGGNVSGTTDLAPLDRQAEVIRELFPDAVNVGMLYCSSEPNSVYQIERVRAFLEDMGYTCTEYSFSDVNDLALVTQNACDGSDVIYIPTDNTCAAYSQIIANVVFPAGVPVVASEASTCAAAGVATLSIDYYELGYATGKMAAQILTGQVDITNLPIQSAGEAAKICAPANCEKLGIVIPEGYTAIE